jgi:hypothetical protein
MCYGTFLHLVLVGNLFVFLYFVHFLNVVQVGKNVYNWHGRTYFMQSLAWLKQLGAKLNMTEQIW